MADSLRIGAAFLDAVREYADQVTEAAQEATQVALNHVQTRLREQASLMENWQEIAQHISIYSQDRRIVVRIPNWETLSQAQDAQHGTDTQPPAPLFRTSQGIQREAAMKAQQYMLARLGPVPL